MKNFKSYELCMQNIQNTMLNRYYNNQNHDNNNNSQNNNEFEEGSEELKLCEKTIIENKLKELNLQESEEAKLIHQMVLFTFKFAYTAFDRQCRKILNVYLAIIKGWINYTPLNIRKEITSKLMPNSPTPMSFNYYFHALCINENILDLDEYQNRIINYLEMPYMRRQTINILSGLKKYKIYDPVNNTNNRLPKIYPFYLDEKKCQKYFTLFGKSCKIPSDLNIITEYVIDYKICNIKDQKTYLLFNRMCYFAFNKIINTKYPFVKIEQAELAKNLNNFITSPFINNDEQLNVFIMLITELCIKRTPSAGDTDNYPDNEARCIYTLLMAVPNTLNKLKMFGNILNGIFKTFHYDYMKTSLNFNQRPYYKLFFTFISLLDNVPNNAKVFNSENTKIQYMNLIADFLKIPSPTNYPGFALAWLDIISCKAFISCFLDEIYSPAKEKNTKIIENYLYLIMDIFNFLKNNVNSNYNKYANKVFIMYISIYIYYLLHIQSLLVGIIIYVLLLLYQRILIYN